MSSNKYHIWNQRKNLSRLICVSNFFFDFFFRSNFYPWSPSGIYEKNDCHQNNYFIDPLSVFLSYNNISHHQFLFSTPQMSFWREAFFHISLRGTRAKNLTEKKSRRKRLKDISVDLDFCTDSKYDICLKTNGGLF